ncbi:rhomboid family intramembrane serine protease [Bacteroidia bacterium]|nr:rhomboid family intramembrane serine protease [Bacteroidia bacterium]
MNFNNGGFLNNIPQVTKNLLLINGIIWFACYLFGGLGIELSPILGLHYVQAHDFHIYQFLTYMFTHEQFAHIFFNMFALWMFGSMMENTWGPQRFLIFYLVCGVGAGLTQEVVAHLQVADFPMYYDMYPVTIGASGAVYGLLLAFGMTFPNAPMFLMFIPIPIKAKWLVIGYGVLEFFSGIGMNDSVAHFAHLGGMLFGILLILYWRRKR